MKNFIRKNIKAIKNWPLSRQIIVIGLIIALIAGFFLSQITKRIEYNYLLDQASDTHNEIFSLFSNASIEAIITEDIPILESLTNQFTGRNLDLNHLIIKNEESVELINWTRKDITIKHPDKVFQKEIIFEGEKFGDVEIEWSMDQTYLEVEKHANLIWLLISLSIIATIVFILVCINKLIIVPIKVIHKKLLSVSQGADIQNIKVNASRELNRLDEAVYQMDETIKLIKIREKELRSTSISRDYLDKIIQGISDTLIVVDSSAIIKTINNATCKLLGYAQKELIGKPFSLLIAEKDFVEKKLLNSSSNSIMNYEMDYIRKNGGRVSMFFSSTNLEESNHKIQDIVCIAKDITERKRFENKLNKLNQELTNNEKTLSKTLSDLQKAHEGLKQAQMQVLQSEKLASIGQLAAGVAHEINNPIGFIGNNIEIFEQYTMYYNKLLISIKALKDSVKGKNTEKSDSVIKEIEELEDQMNLDFIKNDLPELIKDAKQGIQRVRKIVMDLRTFAREDDGQIEDININDILDDIIGIIWHEVKYNSELKKDYGDIPFIKGNPHKIGQVFMNLIINASQAIEREGEITIRTYIEDDNVTIEISDNGSGIEQEKINKIFDAFYTTKGVGEGTGLGLSISSEIIKKHGGNITVESQVGQGSTFRVRLPVKENS